MTTATVKIVHTSIECDWRDAYAFARVPQNMPMWASGLAAGLEPDGEDWIATGALGTVKMRFVPENAFGVVDNTVTLPGGERVYNALRIVQNGDGCEAMVVVRQQPQMTDAQLAAHVKHVEKDLAALKLHLEKKT